MLVTDGGQVIRCPVQGISTTGRRTRGVTVFRVAEGEKVVSITRLAKSETDSEGDEDAVPGSEETELEPNSDNQEAGKSSEPDDQAES